MRKSLPLAMIVLLFLSCGIRPSSQQNVEDREALGRWSSDPTVGHIAQAWSHGDPVQDSTFERIAADPASREPLLEFLTDVNRTQAFPKKYFTIASLAESRLVNWLAYPTELDTFPDEIALVSTERIMEHDSAFSYLVFRFRTELPHWAAEDGWMLGVVGPYLDSDPPDSWPAGTFSCFNTIDKTSPLDEARWTHENVFRRAP